jgi:hypothetical protein
MSTDPEKLAAALEQLEAEKQRRVAAKIEAGEAVRVLLSTVKTQDIEAVRARKLAELRSAGELREIIFDETIIDTGVPRCSDSCRGVVTESSEPILNSSTDAETHNLADRVEDSPEPRRICVQIEPPSARHVGGVVEEGTFTIANGQVHVEDARGRALGSAVLFPGADAAMIARRILRAKKVQRPVSTAR